MFISVEEALKIIENIPMCEKEEPVSVYDCCGRTAAKDLAALISQPPFPRSPLDGFAFRSEDVKGASKEKPAVLKQIGEALAGCSTKFFVGEGQCIRLMTGSPIPEGADAVIGIEDARWDAEGNVEILKEVKHYGNYVFAGEDFKEGQILCSKGDKIDAAAAGCLAAAGYSLVPVCRRPRVAVMATGSEIASPGSPLQHGRIYDSNSVYITSRLKQMGFEASGCIIKDDKEEIKSRLKELIAEFGEGGLVITTGGVSVGDADYMPLVLEELNAEILFRGVALKPGSPLMLGVTEGCYVLCLSGNPYAAAATFELFARAVLERLSGEAVAMKIAEGRLSCSFEKGSGVPRFLRARLEEGQIISPEGHSSGQLYTMHGCTCFAQLPAGPGPYPKGTKLKVYII